MAVPLHGSVGRLRPPPSSGRRPGQAAFLCWDGHCRFPLRVLSLSESQAPAPPVQSNADFLYSACQLTLVVKSLGLGEQSWSLGLLLVTPFVVSVVGFFFGRVMGNKVQSFGSLTFTCGVTSSAEDLVQLLRQMGGGTILEKFIHRNVSRQQRSVV